MSARMSDPMIGRESELQRLERVLDTLAAGSPGCLVIEGEPGIGKTRLLGELCRRADARGQLVLRGSAAEFERDLPFAIVIDALNAHVAANDDVLDDEALAHELAGVLPAADRGGGTAVRVLAGERYRTHRAMRTLLERLAHPAPLVVALDDIHWTDDASIELIRALLRRPPAAPVLLALAFRPGQAPTRLRSALAVEEAEAIELGPLSERESAELLGAGLAPQLRTLIYEESGGNPFYLEQLARSPDVRSIRAAEDRVVAEVGVPRTVAAALIEEVQALPQTSQLLLHAASVACDPFEPALAFEIGELSAGDGVAAFDQLVEMGLFHPSRVPGRFVFRHPLLRRAVYEAAGPGWRLAAHERTAGVLRSVGAGVGIQAPHLELSARQGDEVAIRILLEAGEAAAAQAPAAAVRWFEAVLRLLPDGDRAARIPVLVQFAEALRSIGEYERCRVALIELLDLVAGGRPALRIQVIGALSMVDHFLGRHAQAHERLVAAFAQLPNPGSADAVTLLITLAADAFFTSDFERMRESAVQALAAARELDDEGLLAAAAAMVACAAAHCGAVAEAQDSHVEAAGVFAILPDAQLGQYVDGLDRLGWAGFYLERYDDAVTHFRRGIAVSRATGQSRLIGAMMQGEALSLMMLGRLAEAADRSDGAVEAARIAADPGALSAGLAVGSMVRRAAGDIEGALAAAEESERLAQTFEPGARSAIVGATAAVARLEAGDAARCVESMLASGGGPELTRIPATVRPMFLESLAHAELSRGRPGEAERWAASAEAAAERLRLPVATAAAKRARATVLLAAGQTEAAARLAAEAAAAAESGGARVDAARSCLLAGRALAAAGERTRAIELLRGAERELDACGALRAATEARSELRRLGARREPKSSPGVAGESGIASLTARERQIAELVTARKTNREIGAELFLSPKTIESHLRNIFSKLRASSRVDVARAVEQARRERA